MRKHIKLSSIYPPSQKTSDVSPGMNVKQFPLRRDFDPDEAQGEDASGVSPRELHKWSSQKFGFFKG